MLDWEKLMKGKCFITDLGSEQTREVEGALTAIGRYAVWSPTKAGTHRVVEVGNDCGRLQRKYRVKDGLVCRLRTKGA